MNETLLVSKLEMKPFQLFKRQPRKMVKHTQVIRRQLQATEYN